MLMSMEVFQTCTNYTIGENLWMEEHHEKSSKKLNLLSVAEFFWNNFPFLKKSSCCGTTSLPFHCYFKYYQLRLIRLKTCFKENLWVNFKHIINSSVVLSVISTSFSFFLPYGFYLFNCSIRNSYILWDCMLCWFWYYADCKLLVFLKLFCDALAIFLYKDSKMLIIADILSC